MLALTLASWRSKTKLVLLTCVLLGLCQAAYAKPNIVVLLVDDAGFMDFGGYGGEAKTPNIDALANSGIRFSNYHTSPLCATSRAMLLTGLDSHRTGVGSLPEVVTKEQENVQGYSLKLLPGIDTVADLLRTTGYQTYMTGKWHLGSGLGDLPDSHGFDRSFTLDASGADNWEQKSFLPFYQYAPWFEDGKPARLPDNFYSSRFLVDKMIDYLEERDKKQPFFAYIGFQAIHIPVQAPTEFVEHYQGVYSDGWGALMQRRFDRARAFGLVPAEALPPELHPTLRDWQSLTPAEKKKSERRMMVNAGMLETMDFHIGRLIAWLKSQNALENTLFIITSDNGPEFGDPTSDPVFRIWMALNGYHDDIHRLGQNGSMGAIGPEWASAAATPGSLFKGYASEGGMRVPLIISGPGVVKVRFNNALSFVTDIAPTIIDYAEVDPANVMDGRSLRPVLSGNETQIYSEEEPVAMEVAGNSAVYLGQHKITRNTLPHGDGTWRLHDLHNDPAERIDLSTERPEIKQKLIAIYAEYAKELGVIPMPKDFDIVAQININARHKILKRAMPEILGFTFLILAVFAVVWRYRR